MSPENRTGCGPGGKPTEWEDVPSHVRSTVRARNLADLEIPSDFVKLVRLR